MRLEISSKRIPCQYGRTFASVGYRHRGDQLEDGHKHFNRVAGAIKTSAVISVTFAMKEQKAPD